MIRFISFAFLCLALLTPTQAQQTIDDRIESMTLEHKVGQMFMVSLYGEGLSFSGRGLLSTWQPAGITLFPSNINEPNQITWLTNSYQQAVQDADGIPLFIAVDQEGGWIARLRVGFTEWPSMTLLAAANDADLSYRVGAAMANELRAVGVNMNLAPVADLSTNPNNPIVAQRSPGSEPHLVGEMLAGYINGLQANNVLATTKHFPGHGDTTTDSHVELPIVSYDLDYLESLELIPFQYAIDAGTGAVMTAHIWFSEFDDDPLPASLSYAVTTGILRQRMGYDGIIITDAMDMDAIDTEYLPGESAIMAIQAGADLLTYGPSFGEAKQIEAMQAVVDAVRAGEIPESRIDESVRRVLLAKDSIGILNSWSPLDDSAADERIDVAGTLPLVTEMFDSGVTIAYDDNDLLPLDGDRSVGIIYPGQRISIQRECSVYRDDVEWLTVTDFPSPAEINRAVDVASRVDNVVVFTRNIKDSPQAQELVNALPPEKTIAVALRFPYDQWTYPDVSAYVLTYAPQDPAIPAACGVLFGGQDALGSLVIGLAGR